MAVRILAASIVVATIVLLISPLVTHAIEEFKVFLSMQSLLNPCNGAGSPPPCR